MSILYVDNPEKWRRTVLAYPQWKVTNKEKVLALVLVETVDWFEEQATEDSDLWGSAVRYAPTALVHKSGLSRSTIYRTLKLWASHGLVTLKSEHYRDRQELYRTRCYIELSTQFYNADLDVGRVEKSRGVKKGSKRAMCWCGKHYYRSILICESGHETSLLWKEHVEYEKRIRRQLENG